MADRRTSTIIATDVETSRRLRGKPVLIRVDRVIAGTGPYYAVAYGRRVLADGTVSRSSRAFLSAVVEVATLAPCDVEILIAQVERERIAAQRKADALAADIERMRP